MARNIRTATALPLVPPKVATLAGAAAGVVRPDRPGRLKGNENWLQTCSPSPADSGDSSLISSEVTKPDQAFAVKVRIRPPRVHRRVLGNLVKGVIDRLIYSAFQAHTDSTVLPVVSAPRG